MNVPHDGEIIPPRPKQGAAADMVINFPKRNFANRLSISPVQHQILNILASAGQPIGDRIGHLPRTGDIVDALGMPRNKSAFASVSRSLARLFNLGKSVEDTLDKLASDAKAAADQPPQPDPAQIAAQRDAEAKKQEAAEKRADREMERGFKAAEHQERMAEIKANAAAKRQDARAQENQALIAAGLPPMPDVEPVSTDAVMAALQQQNQQMTQLLMLVAQALTAPKQIVKDQAGRPVGVQTVLPQQQGPLQ